jgi:glutamate synthase (NADPH/NADH) large chain
MLSGEVAKRHGTKACRRHHHIKLTGTAGQASAPSWPSGVTFDLVGDANDYVGKGLSAASIIVRPPENARIVAGEAIIVGNTVLYGAIEGECYFRGVAGERFAVRNSGRHRRGRRRRRSWLRIHDRRCGRRLGETGRNFAAGMSGGIAYVLDEDNVRQPLQHGHGRARTGPEEDDLLEKLHHHGGDLEHKGRVDLSSDMTRHRRGAPAPADHQPCALHGSTGRK